MRITVGRLVTTLLGLAAVAAAWFFLAPGLLGGATNYVFTSGISMQPLFHTGDLAVVRGASDYRVGEIVAYRSRSLHTIVLHRIVARDGAGYVFKGDNNSFRDPEHPTRDQLVGKLWIQLPGVGTKLSFLRTPRMVGVLAGLAVLLLLGGTGSVSRRRSRRRAIGEAARAVRRPGAATSATERGLTAGSVALAAFLALGALAFIRPTEGTATATAAYTQAGTFSYAAAAPAGAIYPSGRAGTGDPLFVRLVDSTNVRFDYRVRSNSPHALTGRASLTAEIAANDGWKRTLQLQPPVSFDGDHVVLTGTLHLRAIERLLRRVETDTAVTGGAVYTLTLLPHVRVSGRLAGAHLRDTFAPRLAFTLDPFQLRPELPDVTTPASSTSQAAAANPLTPSNNRGVKTTHPAANKLSFHAVHLRIAMAREIAAIGAAAALCAVLVFLLLLLRGRRADEPSRIQARHHDLLIPVAATDRCSYDEIVELASFDTLARLAERYDRMILHEQTPLGHSYRIADSGVLFTYLIAHDLALTPHPAYPIPAPAPTPEP